MGIALLAASTLAHPLTALHRWWSGPRATPAVEQFAPPTAQPAPDAVHRPAPCRPARAASPASGPIRMLRSHRSACGRMVISGRMADVCAELERLAASELRH